MQLPNVDAISPALDRNTVNLNIMYEFELDSMQVKSGLSSLRRPFLNVSHLEGGTFLSPVRGLIYHVV